MPAARNEGFWEAGGGLIRAVLLGLFLSALGCPPDARAEDLEFGPAFGVASDGTGRADSLEGRAAAEPGADPSPADLEARKDARECREALDTLRADRLAYIDLDIRVGGRAGNDYPRECRLEGDAYEPREFASTTFTWKAAGYCHKPLYFEQWNLERYGHSRGLVADMFLSGAHFFATVPVLPYKMGVELPWECIYPLGTYRPGSCAPWTVPAIPVSPRVLAVEAATATGAVFLLP